LVCGWYEAWSFTEKLMLFIYLEHLVLVARWLLKLVLPQVPRSVDLEQLRQETVVHRCLEGLHVEHHQDLSMLHNRDQDGIEVFEHDILERDEEEELEPQLEPFESVASLYAGVKEEGHKWLRTPRK